jgi:hypothetical protein
MPDRLMLIPRVPEARSNLVVGMSRSVCASLLGPEFDGFLYAPLGEERNGMPLSVLSALARLQVDPWQEATKLAGLPGAIATERLASLIVLVPNEPSLHRDPDAIAARLVALLPCRTNSDAAPLKTLIGVGKRARSWAVIYMMLMVLALGTEWIVASRQPSGQVDRTRTPASGTISPQVSPSSGR